MMTRIFVHSALFAICATCTWAQTAPQQANGDKSSAAASGYEVIEGCLREAGVQYTLTSKDGVLHHLSGGKLRPYVGHEVELSGKPSIKTVDTTVSGAASSAKEIPIFVVKSVKDIAPSCQSAH